MGLSGVDFSGSARSITKVGWTDAQGGTVWIDGRGTASNFARGTSGFSPVHREVWDFSVGGHRMCQKWLKDRKGRTLSEADITHYKKIVVAISETIRLMAEIDEVIEERAAGPTRLRPLAPGAPNDRGRIVPPNGEMLLRNIPTAPSIRAELATPRPIVFKGNLNGANRHA